MIPKRSACDPCMGASAGINGSLPFGLSLSLSLSAGLCLAARLGVNGTVIIGANSGQVFKMVWGDYRRWLTVRRRSMRIGTGMLRSLPRGLRGPHGPWLRKQVSVCHSILLKCKWAAKGLPSLSASHVARHEYFPRLRAPVVAV